MLYIGNDPIATKNQLCPGSPFMTIDADSDGWYYDESTYGRSAGNAWTYGVEAWCNMEGRYLHIVADLSHLTPPYTMSLCSLGIMGSRYVRDEPVPETLELVQGEIQTVSVSHIYNDFTADAA